MNTISSIDFDHETGELVPATYRRNNNIIEQLHTDYFEDPQWFAVGETGGRLCDWIAAHERDCAANKRLWLSLSQE